MAGKIISDLEPIVTISAGDMLLPIENGVGTFSASVDDIKDYINQNLLEAGISTKGVSYLPKQVTISNGTDTDHDIDFAAGNFQFDDQSGQAVLGALTKQIDAAWAAGTGNGGLDTGTVANDTTYHLFAIHNPTTGISDALFSASLSPTMPSGYTKKRRIASLITDGSANIRNGSYIFNRDGSYKFLYNSGIADLADTTPATVRTAFTVTAPPSTESILRMVAKDNDTGAVSILITSDEQDDLTPNNTNAQLVCADGEFQKVTEAIKLNGSSQANYRSTDSSVTAFTIYTIGWIDNNL